MPISSGLSFGRGSALQPVMPGRDQSSGQRFPWSSNEALPPVLTVSQPAGGLYFFPNNGADPSIRCGPGGGGAGRYSFRCKAAPAALGQVSRPPSRSKPPAFRAGIPGAPPPPPRTRSARVGAALSSTTVSIHRRRPPTWPPWARDANPFRGLCWCRFFRHTRRAPTPNNNRIWSPGGALRSA